MTRNERINRLPNDLRKRLKDIEKIFEYVDNELDEGGITEDQFASFFQLVRQATKNSMEQ